MFSSGWYSFTLVSLILLHEDAFSLCYLSDIAIFLFTIHQRIDTYDGVRNATVRPVLFLLSSFF